jgi:hypothetical protein
MPRELQIAIVTYVASVFGALVVGGLVGFGIAGIVLGGAR